MNTLTKRIFFYFIGAFAISMLFAGTASAAGACYWVGASSTSWSSAANWDASTGGAGGDCSGAGGLPDTSVIAIFDGAGSGTYRNSAVTIPSSTTVYGVTLQGSYTNTVTASTGLTVSHLRVDSGIFSAGTGSSITIDNSVIIGGGAFYGANATIDNDASIYMSSGSYSQSTGTTTVSGGCTIAGGTYSGNSGNITHNGPFTISNGAYNASSGTTIYNDTFEISGGTFSGASASGADIDYNSSLTISSTGSYTATSGTTSIQGNFTFSGGTFTHNSGEIKFDGNSNSTLDLNSTINFYDLTIAKGTDSYALSMNTPDIAYVTSGGTLTATNGLFSGDGVGKIVVQSGAYVSWQQNFDGGLGHVEVLTDNDFTLQEFPDVCKMTVNNEGIRIDTSASGGTIDFDGDFYLIAGEVDDDAGTDFHFAGEYTQDGGHAYMGGASADVTHDDDVTVNGGYYHGENKSAVGTNSITSSGQFLVAGGFADLEETNEVDLNGSPTSLYISSGTFEAPGGTNDLYIQGNLYFSGGTFSHNDGQVSLDGNNVNTLLNVWDGSINFYNLKIIKTGTGTVNYSSDDTYNVENILTFGDGQVVDSTNAQIVLLSGGTLSWPDSTFGGGTGWVRFDTTNNITAPENGNGPRMYLNSSLTMDTTDVSGTGLLTLNALRIANGATFDNDSGEDVEITTTTQIDSGTLYAGDSGTLFQHNGNVTLNGGTHDGETAGEIEFGESGVSNSTLTIAGGAADFTDVTLVDMNEYSDCFAMTSGTFDAPSANMTVASDFEPTGGTFNHNNGTVTFDSNPAPADSRVNVNTTINFYNVVMNKSGTGTSNDVTCYVGDTCNIINNLTLTDGDFGSGGTWVVTSTGALPTWASTWEGGAGLLRLENTGTVTIGDGAGVSQLEINNAALTVNTSGTTALTLPYNFTLTAGTFDDAADVNLTHNGYFYLNGGEWKAGAASHSWNALNNQVNTGATFTAETSNLDFNLRLLIAGGTVSAANANIDIYDPFTALDANSGTLIAPGTGKTFKLNGDIDVESGFNFTHSSGTIETYGTSNSDNFDWGTSDELYNIKVNKTDAPDQTIIRGSATSDNIVFNDMEVVSGTVSLSDETITMKGDWTTASGALVDGSTSDLVLSNANHTFYGNVVSSFHDITQTNPGTTVYFESGNTTTLTGTLTIDGDPGTLNHITIRSTVNGVEAYVDAANYAVDYVDVRDLDNINTPPDYDLSSAAKGHTENTDHGLDNDGWIFDNPYTPIVPIPEFSTWLLILIMLGGMGLIMNKSEFAFTLNKKR